MNFAILFDQQNLRVVYRFIDDVIQASQEAMMSGKYNPFVIIDFAEEIPQAREKAEQYTKAYSKRHLSYNQGYEKNEQI